MQTGVAFPFDRWDERMPKRRKTSKQVTKMERRIKTMMIQVSPAKFIGISQRWKTLE